MPLNDPGQSDNTNKEGLGYEAAAKLVVGDFGKISSNNAVAGVFHAYVIIFMTFSLVTNGYLLYALPFLELFPEYICPPDIPDCTYKDRCLYPDKVHVNWDSHKSLNNWVEIYNLECKFRI